jgi:trehalose/maltose transport system substrate-binding protein
MMDDSDQNIPRRDFIKATGATGVAAGLAGCSAISGKSDGTITLKFITNNDWIANKAELADALHRAGMPEHISVDPLSMGGTTDAAQAKYRMWLSAGEETPDVYLMDSGWTKPFITRDLLLNLSNAFPEGIRETVYNDYAEKSVNTAVGSDGELYALPLYPDVPTIQYRKDLAEKAGYDLEQHATDPMSWRDFSHTIKDIHEQNDIKYGFNWQAAAAEQLSCCVFNEYLSSWGGAYFGNPRGNLYQNIGERPITVAENPVIQSLRMARTFIYGKDDAYALDDFAGAISPASVLQWSLEPSRRPFTSGNAVALRNWPYSIAISGTENALGEKMGVMPMPYGVKPDEATYPLTGGSIAALGGWHLAVNPNSPRRDAALEFLTATTKDSFQLKMFESIGWLPPKLELLTTNKARQVPVMGRYVDQLQFAAQHSLARPVTVLWPQESDQIAQEANAALANTAPKQAMQSLKDSLNALEESV